MQTPQIFSFFSGSGFLDLGFELSGFDVSFVNESHKPFLDAYKYSRASMNIKPPSFGYANHGIEDLLKAENLESFSKLVKSAKSNNTPVGFIGGPPCPDFSVGGKNRGKDGENGKLTEVYVDLITSTLPDFFIFENVKGLRRTAKHREFYEAMKKKLSSSGYLLTDRLTNSIEYGVAQDRDRILLFGILSKSAAKIIDSQDLTKKFNWESYQQYKRSEVLVKNLWPTTDVYTPDSDHPIPQNLKNLEGLTIQYWFDKNKVESHPNAHHFFQPRAGLAKFTIISEGDDSKKSYKRLHRWRYSPTAAYGNNEVHLHPYKSRRISAAEALAIQSLPRDFHFPKDMTLSNMFKTIGNGVPYLLAEGLAKTVYDFLQQHYKTRK